MRLRELTRAWIYRDAHYLAVDVELDRAAARRWVPRPLSLADPPRAIVFQAFFPSTTFGSVYREAGVLFEVTHLRRRAVFSPWMLVDDDVALIAGRELLGYPKKLGELTWQHTGDHIRTSAHRRGHELLAIDGTLGAVIANPPPMLGRAHRNIRASLGVAIPKLIAFTPRERVVEVRHAQLDVRIGGSERVDLGGAWPPLPVGLVSPLGFLRQVLLRGR